MNGVQARLPEVAPLLWFWYDSKDLQRRTQRNIACRYRNYIPRTHLTPIFDVNMVFSFKNRCYTGSRYSIGGIGIGFRSIIRWTAIRHAEPSPRQGFRTKLKSVESYPMRSTLFSIAQIRYCTLRCLAKSSSDDPPVASSARNSVASAGPTLSSRKRAKSSTRGAWLLLGAVSGRLRAALHATGKERGIGARSLPRWDSLTISI